MKRTRIFALMTMVMACVGVAKAEDKIEGTVGADVVTRYIWRGQ